MNNTRFKSFRQNLILYKFIPFDGFRKTLDNWALKCSTIHDVNDVMENVPQTTKSRGALSVNGGIQNAFTEAFFSFSHRMSVPAMWGHYADNARGVCMIFAFPCCKCSEGDYNVYKTSTSYHEISNNGDLGTTKLMDLNYCEERAISPYDGLENMQFKDTKSILTQRLRQLLIRKATCWEYEAEIRLLDSFANADMVLGDYLLYSWPMRYFAGVIAAPKCPKPVSIIRKMIEYAYGNCWKQKPSCIYPFLRDGWIVKNSDYAEKLFSIEADGLKDYMTYDEFSHSYFC